MSFNSALEKINYFTEINWISFGKFGILFTIIWNRMRYKLMLEMTN